MQILDKCRVESLTISEVHANSFLEVINNLIVEQKQKLQEIQNKEEWQWNGADQMTRVYFVRHAQPEHDN